MSVPCVTRIRGIGMDKCYVLSVREVREWMSERLCVKDIVVSVCVMCTRVSKYIHVYEHMRMCVHVDKYERV